MQNRNHIKLIECPRDAMQGWAHFIPTQTKIAYINALLQCGFDTIDFGSFVSPKAIPQLADTPEVLKGLQLEGSFTKLLAIVANVRGADEAVRSDTISCLGFPFSISETFQQRNANSSIEQAFNLVKKIQDLCTRNNKQLVVYISMAFGNPYGDVYSEQLILSWIDKLAGLNIKIVSVADTVGLASPLQVYSLLSKLIPAYPAIEFGVHLHSTPYTWHEKIEAAFKAGCTRFDGAIGGFGGCPMAGNELVGNIDMELIIPHFRQSGVLQINPSALALASKMSREIFV